jgi:DNA-directed RNA polymerase II subunit RPB1
MLIVNLPVLPETARPPTIQGTEDLKDQLTTMYKNIIKTNQQIRTIKGEPRSFGTMKTKTEDLRKLESKLAFDVTHLIKNSDKKCIYGGGSVLMSIQGRVQGKGNLIRGKIQGKRSFYAGRTVVGPNPTLPFGYISIPEDFASHITRPENVTALNIRQLQEMLNDGKILYVTSFKDPKKRKIKIVKDYVLQLGDVVDRHLVNGDYVLCGRQPTLHKQSLMGYKIIINNNMTIGIHLSSTKPHNADFDGDEMYILVPQSLETIAEIQEIMSIDRCMILGKDSSPSTGLVYDSLTSFCIMTRPLKSVIYENGQVKKIEKEMLLSPRTFHTLSSHVFYEDPDIDEHFRRCEKYGIHKYSGKSLFSTLLPKDFNYNKNGVTIINGILVSGVLGKATLGATGGSIIHVMIRNYEPSVFTKFITNATFMADCFLARKGLTFGIDDCFIDENVLSDVKKIVNDAKLKIEHMDEKVIEDELLREQNETKICTALQQLTKRISDDVGDAIKYDSNMSSIIKSGATKTSASVASQINSSLVQQFIQNIRPLPLLYGNRTLVWFPYNDRSIESRGFVNSSFLEGLTPPELFFHQSAGRISLITMALETADTGFMQHKMVKFMEDLTSKYDHSIRDGDNRIIEFQYGDDSFNAERLIVTHIGRKEIRSFVDVEHIFNDLNMSV